MNIKKILLLLPFFLLAIQTFVLGQVHKFRSYKFAIKIENEEWGKWEDTDVLIVPNLRNHQIKIHGREIQVFDVVKMEPGYTDEDGDVNYKFICVNQDGAECIVVHCFCESLKGPQQLFVYYEGISVVYKMSIVK